MDEKTQIAIGTAIGSLRTLQREAENRIARAINEEIRAFERNTGLVVVGMQIEATSYRQIEDRQDRYFPTGARIQWSL